MPFNVTSMECGGAFAKKFIVFLLKNWPLVKMLMINPFLLA